MNTLPALVLLAALPLAPAGLALDAGDPIDPDEPTVCATHGWWEACVRRDHAGTCASLWTGMPPAVEACVQPLGP